MDLGVNIFKVLFQDSLKFLIKKERVSTLPKVSSDGLQATMTLGRQLSPGTHFQMTDTS